MPNKQAINPNRGESFVSWIIRPLIDIKSFSSEAKVFLIISLMLNSMDKIVGSNLVLHLIEKNNLSATNASIILASSSFSLAIFDFPLGNIADKYGRKITLILGTIFASIGVFLFGISDSLFWFIFSVVIQALGLALISGVPISWYFDEARSIGKEKESLRVLSISRFVSTLTAVGCGFVVLPLLRLDERSTFLCASIIGLILSCYCFFHMKENRNKNSTDISTLGLFFKNLQLLTANRGFIVYSLGDLFENIAFFGFIFIWQQQFQKTGLDKSFIGIIYGLMIGMTAIGPYLISAGNEFFEKHKVSIYLISGVICALGFLCLTHSEISGLFILGVILFEFGTGFAFTLNSYITNLLPKGESRTAFLSAISSLTGFESAIVYIGQGYLLEHTSATHVLIVCSLSIFLAFILKAGSSIIAIKNN